MSTLETRVRRLEDASGGGDGGGCDRCRGTLIIVSDANSGEFHSASWNGEPLSEQEAREHETERKCPRCGRRIGLDEASEIRVGGRRRA
jgi:ssDNA-binding Zn-finger/Zn-ribbon topoisomerase 1